MALFSIISITKPSYGHPRCYSWLFTEMSSEPFPPCQAPQQSRVWGAHLWQSPGVFQPWLEPEVYGKLCDPRHVLWRMLSLAVGSCETQWHGDICCMAGVFETVTGRWYFFPLFTFFVKINLHRRREREKMGRTEGENRNNSWWGQRVRWTSISPSIRPQPQPKSGVGRLTDWATQASYGFPRTRSGEENYLPGGIKMSKSLKFWLRIKMKISLVLILLDSVPMNVTPLGD